MIYTIGNQYLSHGKHPKLCTIVDILTTRNSANEITATNYVSTHEFLGQLIKDSTVNNVTIARGIWRLAESKGNTVSPNV